MSLQKSHSVHNWREGRHRFLQIQSHPFVLTYFWRVAQDYQNTQTVKIGELSVHLDIYSVIPPFAYSRTTEPSYNLCTSGKVALAVTTSVAIIRVGCTCNIPSERNSQISVPSYGCLCRDSKIVISLVYMRESSGLLGQLRKDSYTPVCCCCRRPQTRCH